MIDIYNSVNGFIQTPEYKTFLDIYTKNLKQQIDTHVPSLDSSHIQEVKFLKDPKNISALSPFYLVQLDYTGPHDKDFVKDALQKITNSPEEGIKGISKFIVMNKEYESMSQDILQSLPQGSVYQNLYEQDIINHLLKIETNEVIKDKLSLLVTGDMKIKKSEEGNYYFEKRLFEKTNSIPDEYQQKILSRLEKVAQGYPKEKSMEFLSQAIYIKDIQSLDTLENLKKQISNFGNEPQIYNYDSTFIVDNNELLGVVDIKNKSVVLHNNLLQLPKIKKILSQKTFVLEISSQEVQQRIEENKSFEKYYSFLKTQIDQKKKEIEAYMPENLPEMFRGHIVGDILDSDIHFPTLYTIKIDYDYTLHNKSIYLQFHDSIAKEIEKGDFTQANNIFTQYLNMCTNPDEIEKMNNTVIGWKIEGFIQNDKGNIHFSDTLYDTNNYDEAIKHIEQKYLHLGPIEEITQALGITQKIKDNRSVDEVYIDKIKEKVDTYNLESLNIRKQMKTFENAHDLNVFFEELNEEFKENYTILSLKNELDQKFKLSHETAHTEGNIGLDNKITTIKKDLEERSEKWTQQILTFKDDSENLLNIQKNVQKYMNRLKIFCQETNIEFSEFNSHLHKDFLQLYLQYITK